MKAVESEGKSVEEALSRALVLLGLDSDQVEVSVLREPGANGGSSTAIVRVQPKGSEPAPVAERDDDSSPGAVESVTGSKPRREAEKAEGGVLEIEKEAVSGTPEEGRPGGSESTARSTRDVSGETRPQRVTEASQEEEVPLSEEEGARADRAGDFLEDLFEILDLDCYVEVAADRVEGKILVDIAGPDTGVIIGRKGAVLDAVELILNRAMDSAHGGGIRIALDAEGYRERRGEKLRELAVQQAKRAAQTRRPVALEPMSARERRIVHLALEKDAHVRTHSEDEGPDRHVVIEPIRERPKR